MLDLKKWMAKVTNMFIVSQTQTLTSLGKSWVFKRIGNVVYVEAPYDTTAQVVSGINNIGTLNAGLRPSSPQYLKCTNINDDVRLLIDTSGTVQLYSAIAWTGTHNCAFCGYCYITN